MKKPTATKHTLFVELYDYIIVFECFSVLKFHVFKRPRKSFLLCVFQKTVQIVIAYFTDSSKSKWSNTS